MAGWGGKVFDSRWNEEPFVGIAAGGLDTLARRANGTLAVWGDNTWGECEVPALPAGLTYVEAAVGALPDTYHTQGHVVALRRDGSGAVWGENLLRQCHGPTPHGGVC